MITNHYITICCVKEFENCPKNVKKSFFIRDKNNLNNKKFTLDLESNLLSYFDDLPSLTINNLNDTFNGFSSVIQETINTHMSLKKISRRQEKLKRKPWMTKQILADTRKQSSTFKSLFLLGNDSEKKKISKTLKQTEQNNSFCQKKLLH